MSGELEGILLTVVPHLDTFWFSWSSYQSQTDLIGGQSGVSFTVSSPGDRRE